MYRTTDPRFRRRLNELNQTLESANETAQSGLYIFGERYVRPCWEGLESCFSSNCGCLCGGGRKRGRREVVNFDFYDDEWEEEGEGLLGWGGGEGYGTLGTQPERLGGMSYSKVGRKRSLDGGGESGEGSGVVMGGGGFWGRLFGGRPARYQPSVADLQENPGGASSRRYVRGVTEGEALLEGLEEVDGRRQHRRGRSGTQASHETGSSYSSRGDLFPSDNEDDAVPLDDEFAMVLERRTTQSGLDTENSSDKTGHNRPSAGSRTSTRRTFSSRSSKSGRRQRSRTSSSAAPEIIDEASVAAMNMSEAVAIKDEAFAREAMHESVVEERPLSVPELEQQERELEREEEEAVERKRQEALRAAAERGLVIPQSLTSNSAGGNGIEGISRHVYSQPSANVSEIHHSRYAGKGSGAPMEKNEDGSD